MTPLVIAIKEQKIDVIKYLVKKGVDVNLPFISDRGHRYFNSIKFSPLHLALSSLKGKQKYEMVKLLIESGADVNASLIGTSSGDMVKHSDILTEAMGDTKLVKLLLDAGAKLLDKHLYFAVKSKNRELVKMMIDKGLNPNVLVDKISLVREAIGIKDWRILEMVIKAGANVDSINDERPPISRVIALSDKDEIYKKHVELLLNAGCEVNYPKMGYLTRPLYIATRNGELSLIKRLVELGADVHMKLPGQSLLEYSLHHKNVDLVKFFASKKVDFSKGKILGDALEYFNEDVMNYLLSLGAEPNGRNLFMKILRYVKSNDQKYRVLKKFLAADMDPKKTCGEFNSNGRCIGLIIDKIIDEEMAPRFLELMLENGANPSKVSSHYLSPLDASVGKKYEQEYQKILLKYKALAGSNPHYSSGDSKPRSFVYSLIYTKDRARKMSLLRKLRDDGQHFDSRHLFYASLQKDIELMKFFLADGVRADKLHKFRDINNYEVELDMKGLYFVEDGTYFDRSYMRRQGFKPSEKAFNDLVKPTKIIELISPGKSGVFYPSCSELSKKAIEQGINEILNNEDRVPYKIIETKTLEKKKFKENGLKFCRVKVKVVGQLK